MTSSEWVLYRRDRVFGAGYATFFTLLAALLVFG